MTKLITIPKFAELTGLPYRLCLHLIAMGQISSVAVGAVAGSMCARWSNGWRPAAIVRTAGDATQRGSKIRSTRRC
jgi:hypothetical protein